MPIAHSPAYRHETRIGAFVISDLFVRGAVISQFLGDVFGEGRNQWRFTVARPDSIAKPNRPTIDPFAERIEMGRDGAFDESEMREI